MSECIYCWTTSGTHLAKCPLAAASQSPPGGTPNRPLDAAEAAQSPQVGAATIDVCSCGDCDGTPHPGSEGHLYSRPWPPVASADPELAALLRAAHVAINELHGMYAYADLLAGIDSALSRLAGQEGSDGK
jgi:hypothetical protein